TELRTSGWITYAVRERQRHEYTIRLAAVAVATTPVLRQTTAEAQQSADPDIPVGQGAPTEVQLSLLPSQPTKKRTREKRPRRANRSRRPYAARLIMDNCSNCTQWAVVL